MLVPQKKLYIETIDGRIIGVNKLSIKATEEFRVTLQEINEEVNKEEYKHRTFIDGYTKSELFKHLIDSLLGLCDLKADYFDGDTLFNLIFPHANEDGSYSRQGILGKFILGVAKDPKTGKAADHIEAEAVNYYAQTLGNLWASFDEFSEIIDIVNNLDYESLSEIMKYRREALKPPEERAKEQSMKNAKKAAAKFNKKSIKSITKGEEISLGDLM